MSWRLGKPMGETTLLRVQQLQNRFMDGFWEGTRTAVVS